MLFSSANTASQLDSCRIVTSFGMYMCVYAGRVLELLVLLDEYWHKHRLGSYKLVLLHNTAFNTAEFAKSQV